MTEQRDWTRWDEIKQRLGNCRRFLMFAWLSLTNDSALMAVVFYNLTREAGENFAVTMRDGRKIDPYGVHGDK